MTASQDSTSPILIVGAGLGGLGLAQILKAHGIPFQIFERDASSSTRFQGWAVALTHCLSRLKSILPPHLGDLNSTSVNAPLNVVDVGAVLHPVNGDVIGRLGGPAPGQPGHLLRAKRDTLRDFLWTRDLDVQCSKQLSHYTEDDNGVTAFFTDGTSASGSLLIGVDGAYSTVRTQLLSQSVSAAPFIPILGTVTLSREKFEPIHDKGSAAVVAGGDKLRWLLSLLSVEPDRSSATYFYAVCYLSDSPQIEAEWTQTATKAELFEKATSMVTSAPQFFQDILREAGIESIHTPCLRFVEFQPPSSFPNGRVTLGGDAAYTMMPFKGAGANTAFLDMCDLAELLMEAKANGQDLRGKETAVALLKRYEGVILPRGKAMVAGNVPSGKGLEEMFAKSSNSQKVSM